jgi:hypothetical protein
MFLMRLFFVLGERGFIPKMVHGNLGPRSEWRHRVDEPQRNQHQDEFGDGDCRRIGAPTRRANSSRMTS